MKKLTPKQDRFCNEYLVDLNYTQAAIRAGYSKKTAGSIGSENLKKPEIKKRIEHLRKDQIERIQMTADDVLMELFILAKANIGDFFEEGENGEMEFKDFSDITERQWSTVNQVHAKYGEGGVVVEIKLKQYDRVRVIELIGKHLAMWQNRLQIDLNDFDIEIEG